MERRRTSPILSLIIFSMVLSITLVSTPQHVLAATSSEDGVIDANKTAPEKNLTPIRGYWAIVKADSVLTGGLKLNEATELKYDNAVRSYSQRGKELNALISELKDKVKQTKDPASISKYQHEIAAARKQIADNKITGYKNIMMSLSVPQRDRVAGMQLYMVAASKFSRAGLSADQKLKLRKMSYQYGKLYLKAKLENSSSAMQRVKDALYAKVEKQLLSKSAVAQVE